MASITIRNLDDQLEEPLRNAAIRNGHSMEEEAHLILERALASIDHAGGLGSRIRQRFSASDGIELDLPPRQGKASAMELSD